jgi:hypothetical protein
MHGLRRLGVREVRALFGLRSNRARLWRMLTMEVELHFMRSMLQTQAPQSLLLSLPSVVPQSRVCYGSCMARRVDIDGAYRGSLFGTGSLADIHVLQQCSDCQGSFHASCAEFSESAFKRYRKDNPRWSCKQCQRYEYLDSDDEVVHDANFSPTDPEFLPPSATTTTSSSTAKSSTTATDTPRARRSATSAAAAAAAATATTTATSSPPNSPLKPKTQAEMEIVAQIKDMGFEEAEILRAIKARGTNVTQVVDYLMRLKGASSIDYDQIDKLEGRRPRNKRKADEVASESTPEPSKRRRVA